MIYHFFDGALAVGYLVAALFFLKFWRRTGQGLFVWFALAFLVFGFQPALDGVLAPAGEVEARLFLLRPLGFLLIIAGIIWANRKAAG